MAWAGLCLGAAVFAGALFYFIFGNRILNGYVRGKAELRFAQAYPGCALRVGELDYSIFANRLAALSVTLKTKNISFTSGRLALTGVSWARLLQGKAAPAELFANAGLDAADVEMKFFTQQYGARCARLRASVPRSEMSVEGAEVSPLIGDEELFAEHKFRATRFRAAVPELKATGLGFSEMLEGTAYRAGSIEIIRPNFDILVSRYKPVAPFVKSPKMPPEALAAIKKPVRIDTLNITDGRMLYAERVKAGAAPGAVTISTLSVSAQGIDNTGKGSIEVRAQGRLMEEGLIKVKMSIPLDPRGFSLRYSGSLGAMDLTRLNAFLEIAEKIRVKSGSVKELTFNIEVASRKADGRVDAAYQDLTLALRDKDTGSENGLKDQIASFLMNAFKIENTKARNKSGAMGEGKVGYNIKPEDEFMQVVWFSLRSGILSLISFNK